MQDDSPTDCRRDPVVCYTEVGPAVPPADLSEADHLPHHQGGVAARQAPDLARPLPPPLHCGLGVAVSVTPQHHVLPLPHHQVTAGPADGGRLQHLQVGELALHGVGVDLAHVVASVPSLDI